MKKCNRCGITKELNCYSKNSGSKDGYRSICKECKKITDKEYRKKHSKELYLKRIEYQKEYRKNHKDKIKEYSEKYYQANREKVLERKKNYSMTHREQRRLYLNAKFKNDEMFKFNHNVRKLIRDSLNRRCGFKKNQRAIKILGCSLEYFANYIQSKFKKGMTFENYGEWHIDHIIPLSSAKTEEEALKLNHYTNLQPLWAEENIKKGNKIL